MNTILTIDTSSPRCSIALLHNSQLIDRISDSQRQSAQRVLPMISELMSDAGIGFSQLDLIASVAGPGSFTGVRIGVAVAQGLSMSNDDIPVLALSSLATMAMAAFEESEGYQVLVSEEAREGELYFAAYQRSELLGVELIGKEQVGPPERLAALPENRAEEWKAVGNGWSRQEEISSALACRIAGNPWVPQISSQILVNLAGKRLTAGKTTNAEQLRPNYVKDQLDYL